MLDEDQLEFYKNNGYLIVNKLINRLTINKYLSTIKQISSGEYPAILNPDREEYLIAQCSEYITGAENLPEKVDRAENLLKVAKLTRELIADNAIVKILSQLQKSNVSYLMSQMLYKQANTKYAAQAWSPHQDNSYIDSDTPQHPNGFNTQYITTNLFLEEADVTNGSMYVYPGTHKLGRLPCNYQESYRETYGSNPGNSIDPKLYKEYGKVDCSFEIGALLIMNGNLIHGSYANASSKSRPLLSVSYITSGSYFFKGKNARRKEHALPVNYKS